MSNQRLAEIRRIISTALYTLEEEQIVEELRYNYQIDASLAEVQQQLEALNIGSSRSGGYGYSDYGLSAGALSNLPMGPSAMDRYQESCNRSELIALYGSSALDEPYSEAEGGEPSTSDKRKKSKEKSKSKQGKSTSKSKSHRKK